MVDPGQWEVVGGKSKGKITSNGKKKESSGKGSSNGGGPVPTLKVEELGNSFNQNFKLISRSSSLFQ